MTLSSSSNKRLINKTTISNVCIDTRMSHVYILGADASHALDSSAPFITDLLQNALEFTSDTRGGMASKPRADFIIAFILTSLTPSLSLG
jgi:hypothetical protein